MPAGKALLVILFALLTLNFGGVKEVTFLSFIVIFGLTAFALFAGHLLGGPAFGDRAALAIAAAERHSNAPEWFRPGGLYGFVFQNLHPIAYHPYPGQTMFFTVSGVELALG